MKRAKKLIGLLLSAAVLALTPLTALALPAGGYVPTSATRYTLNKSTNKWEKLTTITYNYTNSGKLTKRTVKWDGGSCSHTYTWNGNYITKHKFKTLNTSYYVSEEYTFKNDKLLTFKTKEYGHNDGKYPNIKWKGKTGTMTWKDGHKTKYTVNKKGQLIKETDGAETTTYEYYKNGNLKRITRKENGRTLSTKKFNQKGYITSKAYTYTIKNGKITKLVIKDSDGTRKYVFNKWKKVSHIRNCDAWGTYIDLDWF